MKFGVVIPSRCAPRPGGRILHDFGPELWLDGALASARAQTIFCDSTWDVVVGLSAGQLVPPHIHDYAHVVWADKPGQAAAVNVAAEVALVAGADVLLFLEDDDLWLPRKTTMQLPYLESAPFVSCSMRLMDEARERQVGWADYPTPSGWMMTANLWRRIGGFNEGIRWRVDTEWLGRLNAAKIPRTHLVEGAKRPVPVSHFITKSSEVCGCASPVPLVDKTINSKGGMTAITEDDEARREADLEAAAIREKFGENPW